MTTGIVTKNGINSFCVQDVFNIERPKFLGRKEVCDCHPNIHTLNCNDNSDLYLFEYDFQIIESLISKVSFYELNIGDLEDNFTLVSEQSGGNFVSLKNSFNIKVLPG